MEDLKRMIAEARQRLYPDEPLKQGELFVSQIVPVTYPVTVELRWDSTHNKVEAWWPHASLVCWFRCWREALPEVLHDIDKVQAKVCVKVRPSFGTYTP